MMNQPGGARTLIGIDVGGSKVLAALVEVAPGAPPQVVATEQVGSATGDVVDSVVAVAQVLAGHPAAPDAIGVGLAGFVGLDGVPLAAPNVPGIVGVDVGRHLEQRCGLPTTVDNDANCVARAAAALRVPSIDDLVAITLGTGIGGGLVVGGELVRGARGLAGEPGHMVVDPNGPPCPCGQRGCWERYASGSGLAALAARAVTEGRAPGLATPRTAGGGAVREPVRGEEVMSAAAAGDTGALGVLEEFSGWLALGIANLVNLIDPEVVVVGGGLVAAEHQFLPGVRRRLRSYPTVADRGVVVEAVPGGTQAGAIGAALAAAHPPAAPRR